jgi:6-phosphogluconate dehydrogenase
MTDESPMRIGMVGLGRMGANMVRRLLRAGHQCRVYDVSEQAVKQLVGEGAEGAGSLADLVAGLAPPRTVWLMLPTAVTGRTATELLELLQSGDAIVDGGNSSYRDDIDRAQVAASRGIDYKVQSAQRLEFGGHVAASDAS